MTRARTRAAATLLVVAIIAGALLLALRLREPKPLPPRRVTDRPVLLLLTSLPLQFGEGFSLRQTGSPALRALNSRYRVEPISVADPAGLAKGRLLLMAQPLAQPAEDLVALDRWVRGGGHLLLLADPMLEWPSSRPLGDPTRPAAMFMDTGLLAHWGLRLDPPEKLGPKRERLAGFDVMTVSPGRLEGACRVSGDRLVADCMIGNGRAVIVADADFLDAPVLGGAGKNNLDALLAELATLEQE